MSRFSFGELFLLLVLGALVAISSLLVTWKIAESAEPGEARAQLPARAEPAREARGELEAPPVDEPKSSLGRSSVPDRGDSI